ncbi:hypothetical protein PG991_007169 [Apiospora marii]|uniref:Thioesterase domain-containing protein n=1 Tax=Apiospora marii TaxID=335849 RepID=A0ABR1RSQ6_9PEZI
MKNTDQLQRPEQHQLTTRTSTTNTKTTTFEGGKTPPHCKILHLQGSPEQSSGTATPTIFLLSDETGSSIGYVQLPSLGGSCVYGIDWPADLDLADETGGDLLSSLADSIAASITAHAAPSPYIIGGVCFGAVLAVEVARRMPAADISSVLLLDPPTGAGDVMRTKDRLAKTRVLRPAQGVRIEAASKALGSYKFEVAAWESPDMPGRATLLVPEQVDDEGAEKWRGWLPGATIRRVDGAQAGGFLRFPSVSFSLSLS